MALAHVEFDATDESGNLLSNVEARVEIEGGGLVSIYSDRAGASPLSNPVTFADGHVNFYAAGGNHKITLTQGAYTRALRDVAIGLLAEKDTITTSLITDFSTKTRELLTANRTYYVRTDGSDSNDGLADTAGGAFLTIQKAIDTAYVLDLSGFAVTIQLGDGTYTAGGLADKPFVGGEATIQGNSGTPANVVVSVTGGQCITVQGAGSRLTVKDFKVQTTTTGHGLLAQQFGELHYSNMNFGACAQQHVRCLNFALIVCDGNYTISGGGTRHWNCDGGGGISCISKTITITGTPALTIFAQSQTCSWLTVNANTFSGSATGTRYSALLNGVINTNGGGATYLPGDVGGATATGGQYI